MIGLTEVGNEQLRQGKTGDFPATDHRTGIGACNSIVTGNERLRCRDTATLLILDQRLSVAESRFGVMRKLLAMAILSSLLRLFGCGKPESKERRSVATGSDNGFPMIVRFRNKIPEGVQPSDYPHLMAIAWSYEPQTNGMPSREITHQMEEFENLLDKGLESRREAFMTVAVTCNGRREWQWYARDQDHFIRLLNSALAGRSPFPVQISHQDDKEWAAYQRFQERARQ